MQFSVCQLHLSLSLGEHLTVSALCHEYGYRNQDKACEGCTQLVWRTFPTRCDVSSDLCSRIVIKIMLGTPIKVLAFRTRVLERNSSARSIMI